MTRNELDDSLWTSDDIAQFYQTRVKITPVGATINRQTDRLTNLLTDTSDFTSIIGRMLQQ